MEGKKQTGAIYIDIVLKAKFSWLTALKLRFAGAGYMKQYFEKIIEKDCPNKYEYKVPHDS